MMTAINGQKHNYLTLDQLAINRDLARQLPWWLAFKYHAVPIARENSHITVVMANPNDEEGRAALAAALKAEVYPVCGSLATIDQLLADIWPDAPENPPDLLLCPHALTEVVAYAHYLADLLNARLTQAATEPTTHLNHLTQFAAYDLVIMNEPGQSLLHRVFSSPAGCKVVRHNPTSTLVAHNPTWPLKKILMITRGQAQVDDPAIEWLIRLAQPSGAEVTVQALVLSTSVMCQQALTHMPHGVADWLMSDTPLGYQLRQIARRLENWQIKGRLHFRQGAPERQIQQEVGQEAYDLIIIAADSTNWWERRLFGNLVDDLLHWVDKPVLVAKSVAREGVSQQEEE